LRGEKLPFLRGGGGERGGGWISYLKLNKDTRNKTEKIGRRNQKIARRYGGKRKRMQQLKKPRKAET
jgi:hypothetical protein